MSYTNKELDEQNRGKVNLDEVVPDEWNLSKKTKINDSHNTSEEKKELPKKVNLNEVM